MGMVRQSKPECAILWFRQDLRLHDNPALLAASHDCRPVLAVYIAEADNLYEGGEPNSGDEAGRWPLGGASRWWLHGSLQALSADLARLGNRLVLRRGAATRILPELAEAVGATEIHAAVAHEPVLRGLDKEVLSTLERSGRSLVLHPGATLVDPDVIRTKTGGIYGMYTPFARAVLGLGEPRLPLPPPQRLPAPAVSAASDVLDEWRLLPSKPDWAAGLRATWTPGEGAARGRLQRFLRQAAERYAIGRNLPGEEGTSMLSPHLHFGEISPSSIWHEVRAAGTPETSKAFLGELIWRDFSTYLLRHNRDLPDKPLRPAFARLGWRDDKEQLAAWQQGRTGVPIVDAGMRQLWQTGWMHNRVRMITASFLVKHLLISWRTGAAWFWDTLVDADLASNGASWQWVAGTGIDAQPFFRVFNPVTQGEKFDADGGYVRRFVPELSRLPDRYLHAPWTAPASVLAKAQVTLGSTYPRPLIDLSDGRARALDVYRRTVREARP